MIIRNDDVAFDTPLHELEWFCNLCDKHGFQILQCITILGVCMPIDYRMTNDQIVSLGGKKTFFDNKPVWDYLRSRNDLIAVHGLWHSHAPSLMDIRLADTLLTACGLPAEYFVPPFNEGIYEPIVEGLTVSQLTDRLEDFHDQGTPKTEIAYLHSWRYGRHYPKEALERCLSRISTTLVK